MTATRSSRRNSVLIAAGIALAFAAWLLSGLGDDLPESSQSEASDGELMRVTVETSIARTMQREIVASARTEPNRMIELKAETEGMVVSIDAERGAQIASGGSIIELDMRDRYSRLDEAEALIRQRELEYEAAQRLFDEQFMSEADLAGAEALLVSAHASQERIALDIERTTISAPFESVVFDRLVEIGDYVGVGDPIAQLVDADPLIVVGNINERDIGALRAGGPGVARLLNDLEVEGVIRYLAPVADESTRSFRVELAIPNADRSLPVGTSAELVLGADEITAHSLPLSALWLADDGTVGVQTVDRSNRVRFLPVNLLPSADAEGQLVTGLPTEVRIITVGQGFVAEGQEVIPGEAETALSQAPDERAY